MITQDRLKELMAYVDGEMVWLVNRGKASANSSISCVDKKTGYKVCKVDQKNYLVHRLVYLYHHGYCPEIIDHINQIKTDNRIENLRPSNKSLNALNSKKRCDSQAIYRGVSFHKKDRKWRARVGTKFLGNFNTPEAAKLVVEAYREELLRKGI